MCPIDNPEIIGRKQGEQSLMQSRWLRLCIAPKQDHPNVITQKEQRTFQLIEHDVFRQHSLPCRQSPLMGSTHNTHTRMGNGLFWPLPIRVWELWVLPIRGDWRHGRECW